MRKVNKLVGTIDSDTLFAAGVQQVVAEKRARPTNYRDYELAAILRKESALAKETPEKPNQQIVNALDIFEPFFKASFFKHA